ncbi:MAG TPA: hypothetical protein VLM89_01005 [Phycisphaerae bacterium]|nr:hypothetical protein [Phycisphaerae bacterium]
MFLAVAWCGCAPQPGRVSRVGPVVGPPEPMDVVIGRVNRNAAAMDFLLKAGGVSATGEFERDDRRASFQLHGTLLFQRPRNLYLKLEHVGGTIEAGSNEEEFWYWEKFEPSRYLWGRHEQMANGFEADIPLRPDLLAEVLGLGGLPTDTKGRDGPALWVGSDFYELVFDHLDPTDQKCLTKVIDIDRREPFLVRSLVYFGAGGLPVVQARLDDYQSIGDSGVLAPRQIRIDWLPDRGWVELSFTTMQRFDNPAARSRFRSPREQGLDIGESRRVDRPPTAASPLQPASQNTSKPEVQVTRPAEG